MNQIQSTPKPSAMAIWSLVLGILGLVGVACCGCFAFFASITAIILGHIERSNIKKSDVPVTGGGMALAGIILGYVGIALDIIFVLIFAMTIILDDMAMTDDTRKALEARNDLTVVECYMAHPGHPTLPTMAQLASETQCGFQPNTNATIEINGRVNRFQISVVDVAGDCMMGDRYTQTHA